MRTNEVDVEKRLERKNSEKHRKKLSRRHQAIFEKRKQITKKAKKLNKAKT